MSWWEALVLGLAQGLTEFFPVSSSGHLVMLQTLLGLEIPGIAFEIVVHVATLLSVLIVYREAVQRLIGGLLRGQSDSRSYLGKLVLASLPAAAAYVVGGDWVESQFDDPAFAGTMLLVTGSFLWSTRWAREHRRPSVLEALPLVLAGVAAFLAGTLLAFVAVLGALGALAAVSRASAGDWHAPPRWGGALTMGIAQALALFPGISRSGSTVVTGLWRRVDPEAAAEFSFLMSLVAVGGAALLKIPDMIETGFGVGPVPLAVGFVSAALSGILAIRFFVLLLKRQNFFVFAWYAWAVGGLFLLYVREAP